MCFTKGLFHSFTKLNKCSFYKGFVSLVYQAKQACVLQRVCFISFTKLNMHVFYKGFVSLVYQARSKQAFFLQMVCLISFTKLNKHEIPRTSKSWRRILGVELFSVLNCPLIVQNARSEQSEIKIIKVIYTFKSCTRNKKNKGYHHFKWISRYEHYSLCT